MQAPASVERPGRPGCPWPAIGVADRAGEVARTKRRRLARLACGPCSSRSRRLAARSRRREVYEGLDHDQYCAGDVKLRVDSRTFAWAGRTLPGAVPPGADARPSPQAAVAASRQSYAVPAPQLHGRAGSGRIHAASTANGIGVPLRDGRTSHAVALAITLCRCRRPVHSARAVDARVPIIARLRTPHSMVRGRRTHHRRGRTPSCRRPRPHLDRSPPRRSLTTARGLVVLASLRSDAAVIGPT
jgi:hypothetical protein